MKQTALFEVFHFYFRSCPRLKVDVIFLHTLTSSDKYKALERRCHSNPLQLNNDKSPLLTFATATLIKLLLNQPTKKCHYWLSLLRRHDIHEYFTRQAV